MSSLKLLIRSFEDKPMKILTDFILKSVCFKVAGVTELTPAGVGGV